MVVKLKFISPHTSFMNWLVKPKYASVAILHIGCQTGQNRASLVR